MLSPTTAICWSESNSASLHQTQGASGSARGRDLSTVQRAMSRVSAPRHARDARRTCRNARFHVFFYLFAPKGERAGREAPPPQAADITSPHIDLRIRDRKITGRRTGGGGIRCRVESDIQEGAKRSCPAGEAVRPNGRSIRSLRTQQRALVKCQITSIQLRLNEIPLDQSPALWCRQRIVSNDIPLVRSNSLGQSISG